MAEDQGGGPRRTFPPYSREEVAVIKEAVANGDPLHCPICNAALGRFPFDMLGVPGEGATELRCEPCRRFLVVRENLAAD